MSFIKNLVIGLLSFLLFLSLGVFGLAYALNSTLLNPDFIVAEIDNLDVASLSRDLFGNQLADELTRQMPAEYQGLARVQVRQLVYNVVGEIEPTLKEELSYL